MRYWSFPLFEVGLPLCGASTENHKKLSWLVSSSKFQGRLVAPTPQHLWLVKYFKQFTLQRKLLIPDLSCAVSQQLSGCDLDPEPYTGDVVVLGEPDTVLCLHQSGTKTGSFSSRDNCNSFDCISLLCTCTLLITTWLVQCDSKAGFHWSKNIRCSGAHCMLFIMCVPQRSIILESGTKWSAQHVILSSWSHSSRVSG